MTSVHPSIALADARLQRLISNGYFPSELPPPFTTRNFSAHSVAFRNRWNAAEIRKFWTKPEAFSSPRYGHARRSLSVVNPVNQLHVADLISKNWLSIKSRLRRSGTSEFKPEIVLTGPGRAVTGVDFDGVARRKAEILSTYGRYVRTDIARFYPSIYTHSIAWAILGKEFCKINHHTKALKTSYANYLDKAVASGQEGQTVGVPIGPDTSRILSELVAVEIECLAREIMPDWEKRCVRYVDDMIVGDRR